MTRKWLNKYNIQYDKLILTNAYNHQEKVDICILDYIHDIGKKFNEHGGVFPHAINGYNIYDLFPEIKENL